MQRKITFCLGFLAAAAALTAVAVENDQETAQEVYTVPVTFVPTLPQFNDCVIDNVNEDMTSWEYQSENNSGTFFYGYNGSNPANDWCFLPEVHLMPGKYKISYEYKTKSMSENFSLYFGQGTNPANYSNPLLDKYSYTNDTFIVDE